MSNTLLEHTRGLHEDLERLERVIVKDYKQDVKGHKDKLMQQHRVRKRLDQMQETAQKLARIYEDEDGARKEEVDALGGAASNIYSKFYDRLKEVRDYHRRFANTEVTGPEDDEPLLKEEPHVEFTGEEAMGRYLDLHEHHLRFINSKFGSRIDYLEYLRSVVQFGAIAKPQKLTKPYREYLEGLVSYLRGFYERTQPLTQLGKQLAKVEEDVGAKWDAGQLGKQLAKVEEDVGAKWDAGQLPGWEDRGRGRVDQEEVMRNLVDLESFESVEELQEIGADKLKEALQALGLKCGGTPQQRAERLFMCKGRALESLDPKLFAKGVVPAGALTPEQQQKMDAHAKRVAVLESQATRLSELLTNILSDTIGRTEKKQSQTYEELLAEQEEAMEEAMEEEVDEDEDEFIYNPLKLPLGWDGKPIPYWLYKLHGLNQEFKCEICGNFSYWGRRAFEKHFKEWRHQNGMRALQIPNNKNFYEVTKIEDALALHRALSEKNRGGWNPEVDEEFEDSRGNVYNKKTYEDLKRQGLLD